MAYIGQSETLENLQLPEAVEEVVREEVLAISKACERARQIQNYGEARIDQLRQAARNTLAGLRTKIWGLKPDQAPTDPAKTKEETEKGIKAVRQAGAKIRKSFNVT